MSDQIAIIIGANSEIAKSLAIKLFAQGSYQLVVLSRDVTFYEQALPNVQRIKVNSYEQTDISKACLQVKSMISNEAVTRVFICNGLLHNTICFPEKRLEAFNAEAFNEVINANTLTPMLWLQQLFPLISANTLCKFVVFSARVGSISDNHLGGWYSYRASKAALNMMLKSAAIELQRRTPHIKLISFHPGTTDTPLSRPFQQNVSEGKLFAPDFVAQQLIHITDKAKHDGELSYLDWQEQSIPW